MSLEANGEAVKRNPPKAKSKLREHLVGFIAVTVIGGFGLYRNSLMCQIKRCDGDPLWGILGALMWLGYLVYIIYLAISESDNRGDEEVRPLRAQGQDVNGISQGTENAIMPRDIPPGFVTSDRRRLPVNERVFCKWRGEGVVVGTGRNRHFVRVRFEEGGIEAEVEAFGLSYKK